MNTGAAGSLLASLDWVSRDVRPILARALDGHEVSVEDGIALARAEGRDFHALTLVADEMRRRQAGEVVTYVVNRNVNFTNVCIKHCTFCAFSRDHREEEGYFLPVDEVVRRAREASELGAIGARERDAVFDGHLVAVERASEDRADIARDPVERREEATSSASVHKIP